MFLQLLYLEGSYVKYIPLDIAECDKIANLACLDQQN